MSRLRFGVIGCSRVAMKGVLPALGDAPSAMLGMVGSRSQEKAKEIAAAFHAPAWGTYEDVLQNKEIDAVYLSLPNALHEAWAIRALEAGKHVVCEKPAATSYASAKRMVEAAQKNHVRLLEGLMFRHHPQNRKAHRMIEEGVLGDLLRFDGCFGYPTPDRENSAMKKELEGGSLPACGVYPVAASRMIFGEEPLSVFCTQKMDPESGVDLETHMLLTYSRERVAFVSSIFGSYYQSTYSVLGTKALLRMGRAYAVPREMETKMFLEREDQTEEMRIEPADHFKLMLEDFCREVALGQASHIDFEKDLLAQARVLQAARLSVVEKRVVAISEIQ